MVLDPSRMGEFIKKSFSDATLVSPLETRADTIADSRLRDVIDLLNKKQDLILKLRDMSESNYCIKKNIKYLDARIGCMIKLQRDAVEILSNSRKKSKKKRKFAAELELGSVKAEIPLPNDHTRQVFFWQKANELKKLYGSLLSVLQIEPYHLAKILTSMDRNEQDRLIKIIMETLYEPDERDEYLLLSLIHV